MYHLSKFIEKKKILLKRILYRSSKISSEHNINKNCNENDKINLFLNSLKNNNYIFNSSDKILNVNNNSNINNLKEFNQEVYQQLISLEFNSIDFDETIDKDNNILSVTCLSKHKRGHFLVIVYKIEINIESKKKKIFDYKLIDHNKVFILKKYLCLNYNYFDLLNYDIQKEFFFQKLACEKSNLNISKLYFWGLNTKSYYGYIVMENICQDIYTPIGKIKINNQQKSELINYLDYIHQEFLNLNFYHNDLINSGNILVKKKNLRFKDSYVIDFGQADLIEYRPFKKIDINNYNC